MYFMYYNFVRIHKTLKITRAMVAGVIDRLWEIENFVALIDTSAPASKKRGPYKKEIRIEARPCASLP